MDIPKERKINRCTEDYLDRDDTEKNPLLFVIVMYIHYGKIW
jgi:hypothetical protein